MDTEVGLGSAETPRPADSSRIAGEVPGTWEEPPPSTTPKTPLGVPPRMGSQEGDLLGRLLQIRRAESESKTLAKVPPDFFASSVAGLQELYQTLERAVATNPTSAETEAARTAFQRARTTYLELVEWRTAKIMGMAVQVQPGLMSDQSATRLTAEERALYDQLTGQIREYWGARTGGIPSKPTRPR